MSAAFNFAFKLFEDGRVTMGRDCLSRLGLINILGLVALAGWSQSSSAQSPRPSATPSAPQRNLLHDLAPTPTAGPLSSDPTQPTPVDPTTKHKILTSGPPCQQ